MLTPSLPIDWATSFLRAIVAPDSELLDLWLTTNDLSLKRAKWLRGQGLAPYVCARLQHTGLLSRLPSDSRTVLQVAQYHTTAQNVLLLSELSDLLPQLRLLHVDPIVLKGMALGTTVYPGLFTRPMSDLDLLITEADIDTVERLFQARNYHDMGLDPERHAAFPSHLHAWRSYPNDQRIVIEAHWNLFHESDYRKLDLSQIRRRTLLVELPDCSFRVLDPIDQLVHACGHLLLHHTQSWNLMWLLDLRVLVDHYSLIWNWNDVISRATEAQLAGAVKYWLQLTASWFGDFLPVPAKQTLATVQAGPEEAWHIELTSKQPARVWQVFWKRARGLSFGRRLATYRQIVFPPWSYMRYRYGARYWLLAPVYYGWRAIRAAWLAFKRSV